MKINALLVALFLLMLLLFIRAFFPIHVDFPLEVINGINLIFDVTCGSLIVSILTYLMTVAFPNYKNTKLVKNLVKYKLLQLDLLKWTPGDVNGTKNNSFEEFMSEFSFNLYFKFFPIDITNSTGMGIIRIWMNDIQRVFNEITIYISYLDIDLLKKLEDIKNRDIFWQINSIDTLYKSKGVDKKIITDQSISLIKNLDLLNKEIKNIMNSI